MADQGFEGGWGGGKSNRQERKKWRITKRAIDKVLTSQNVKGFSDAICVGLLPWSSEDAILGPPLNCFGYIKCDVLCAMTQGTQEVGILRFPFPSPPSSILKSLTG